MSNPPAHTAPHGVRFDHTDPAIPAGTATPRLSWQLPEVPDRFIATAYEVELDSGDGAPLTRRVESAEQVLVPWPFDPLPSRFRGTVRIRVAAGAEMTAWSDPVPLETSLLSEDDWSARFVTPRTIGGIGDPAPLLAGSADIGTDTVSARLYITALGVHTTWINGHRVGDEELAPGWTSYPNRLRFRAHDVTELLRPGTNHIEVLLGNGWYRGRLGWDGQRGRYGDRLAVLAQLETTRADGNVTVMGTDSTWIARHSAVLADDLYDGQTTDLRGAADDATDTVEILDERFDRLVPAQSPPVRAVAVVPATDLVRTPSGRLLADFGENLVGWVRLRLRGGTAGQRVTLRHAEVLEDGELGVRPLRTARATDEYLLAGGDEETCEPSLTFHGFRYAEIDGVDEDGIISVAAVALSSDLRPTGSFGCSEPDLNTLHANVARSMRGNFLDVPTDCPQRDERMGWTGDIQVFAPTASFLADSAAFLTSWLRDLAAEQFPDGSVPFVVPDVLGTPGVAAAAWGDAATMLPWTLYERFGDAGVLAEQFDSMCAWVDRQAELAGRDRLWTGGFQFGDWLDPTAPPEAPQEAKADADLVATAHLARSAELVARSARVIGRHAEAEHYEELAAAVREAFAREYVTPSGRVVSDAPTAYALALVWDLIPDEHQRARAGERLADLVRSAGFRIATGFVGTPLMCDALTTVGEVATAYRLLLERGCPSWLYPVSMGATTVWERWDSMLPDGSINPGEMTSFNHYALGAVADWMHRTVAGLAPGAPGYREIVVRPLPGGGLSHAEAALDTPYGRASVAWRRARGRFQLDVTVPPGARAIVHLPEAGDPVYVGHGEHTWDIDDPTPGPQPLRTVRDALDHAELWSELVTTVVAAGIAEDAASAAAATARHLDLPLTELPTVLAPPLLAGEAQQVRARINEILARYASTK